MDVNCIDTESKFSGNTLTLRAFSDLQEFFRSKDHRPSTEMMEGLYNTINNLSQQLQGTLPAKYYICALDPGVGKTSAIKAWISNYLKRGHEHNNMGVHLKKRITMTTLQGSEKQVSWANRIRTARLSRWKSSDHIAFQKVESVLQAEISAAWWIAHREKELGEVLGYIGGGSTAAGKAVVKPKITTPPASSSSSRTFVATTDAGGVTRYVGELRSVATGEVVVDPECPF